MSAIHFDITGDNSNIVSVVNDTTKRMEELSSFMKGLSNEGLDFSNSEKALEGLQLYMNGLAGSIEACIEELNRLSDEQAKALTAGDTKKVEEYSQKMKEVADTVQLLREQYNQAAGAADIINDIDTTKLKEVEELGEKIAAQFGGDSQNSASGALDYFAGKLKTAFSIAGITAFINKVYQTRSYFQDIESSMEVFLGSQAKANKFTEELKDYAYYNMFEFQDLASASQQLIAYGNDVEDVIPIIHKLSEVATATKAPLSEFVSMYNKAKNLGGVDSRSLQSWAAHGLVLNDVLKEMGEEVNGTSISFEQLDKALNHVTEKGQMFGGIMEKMMPNLSSSIGQFEDNLSSMFNEIGESLQDEMHDAIDTAANIVANYQAYGKVLLGIIATIGTYKAALMTMRAWEKAEMVYKNVQAYMALKKELGAATVNQILFNKAAKANIYIALGAALVGVITALATFNKKQEESIRTQGEATTKIREETSALEELYSVAKDEKRSMEERTEAITTINTKYGDYLSSLGIETVSVDNLTTSYNQLRDAIQNSYLEKLKAQTVGEAQSDFNDAEASLFGFNQKLTGKAKGAFSQGRLNAEVEKFIKDHPLYDAQTMFNEIERIYGKYGISLSSHQQGDLYKYIYNYREADKSLKQAEKGFDAFAAGYKSVSEAAKQSQEEQKTSLSDVVKAIGVKESQISALRKKAASGGITEQEEKELKNLEEGLDALDKRYKLLTGNSRSNASKKRDKDAQADIEAATARADLLEKLKAKQADAIRDAGTLAIQAEDDSYAKESRTLEAQHNARVAQIQAEYDSTINEIEKLQRKAYKKKNGTEKGFTFDVTDSAIQEAGALLDKNLKNEDTRYGNEQKAHLQALVDSYKTYTQQRQEIIEQGIAEALELEAAGYEKEAEERRKAMEQELTALDSQNNEIYKRLAQDTTKWGVVAIQKAIADAQAEVNRLSATPEMATANAQAIDNLLRKIEQLKQSTKDFSARGLLGMLFKPDESGGKSGAGTGSIAERMKAIRKQWDALSKEDKWKNIGGYATSFGNALVKAAGAMKEIAEATGNDGLANAAETMEGIGGMMSNIGQGFAQGGWIGGAISAVQSIFDATLGAITNIVKQEAIAKKYADDWAASIERLSISVDDSAFQTIFGQKNIDYGRAKLKEATSALALYRREVGNLSKMSVKTYDSTWWERLWGGSDKYTNIRSLASEMFDADGGLNVEYAKRFLEVNQQLTDEQRKQIENAISLKEQYEEAIATVDGLISDTFGNLASDISNVIWDSVMSGSDAWEQFEEVGSEAIANLGKQLIQEMLISEYLEQFRDKMRNAYQKGSPEETQKELRNVVGDIFGGMQNMLAAGSLVAEEYKSWAEQHGFDLTQLNSETQTATAGGFQTMSQDTASELNGRFTALQLSNELISQSARAGVEFLSTISGMVTSGDKTLGEIRDLHVLEVGYLEDISKYTKTMAGFEETLNKIEKNTSKL